MDRSEGLFVGVILLLMVLSVMLVLPFLQFVLLSVLLAYVLYPVQRRLAPRIGGRAAAASLVTLAMLSVVIPLVLVAREIAADAIAFIEGVQQGEITLGVIESYIQEQTGVTVDLSSALESVAAELGNGTVGNVLDVFGTVSHLLVGGLLTLFLLFFFLKDGDRFVGWLHATTPLEESVRNDLQESVDSMVQAVLIGHVLVAIIQGTMAGIGLAIAGIPNAVFWTVVMIVLSLLPIVGSFLVWGPACLYLLAVGRPLAAGLLFVYGAIVVGVADDYLRPIVVDRYARLNPSIIVIGVLGGMYVFGVMGLFFGPVIIGVLKAALDVYRREYTTAVDPNPD